MLNTIFGTLSSGVPPFVAGNYDSISTVTVGSGGSASISFSSIPSDYTHLQIRVFSRLSTNADYSVFMRVGNGSIDSGSNYSWHGLRGNGAAVSALHSPTQTEMYIWSAGTQINNVGGVAVIDILDYNNTNKYKTVRVLGGADNNGNGYANLFSGNWQSTSAINTISLTPQSDNWAQHSSFALYGIKGS